MKVKELIEDLENYNPELEVVVMYPIKDQCAFLRLDKKGLVKLHTGSKYYLELEHSKDSHFNLIEEVKGKEDENRT